MDAYGRPETWRELWREATPAERRRLVSLLAHLALIVIIAAGACGVAVWAAAEAVRVALAG